MDTGQPIWQKSFDLQEVVTQASYADGLIVYATSDRTNLQAALNVRRASDGELLYTYPLPQSFTVLAPTLAHDPTTDQLVAYVGGATTNAISLTPTGATQLWKQDGAESDFSVPTIAGDSVIIAAPGHYYAVDRHTGQLNSFHAAAFGGGGGSTAAYDEQRHELYINGDYDFDQFGFTYNALSAYRYNANGDIQLLWSTPSPQGDIAIGPDGNVFLGGLGLVEYNPETGQEIREIGPPSTYLAPSAPVISAKYLWGMSEFGTVAFDPLTGNVVRNFVGPTAEPITGGERIYRSVGAIGSNFIVLREPDPFPSLAFHLDVFLVPEPSTLALAVVACGVIMLWRRYIRQ